MLLLLLLIYFFITNAGGWAKRSRALLPPGRMGPTWTMALSLIRREQQHYYDDFIFPFHLPSRSSLGTLFFVLRTC